MTTISVIVCTRNRAESLRACLARLGALPAPAGTLVEILVVDNGSTDATPAVIVEQEQHSAHQMYRLEEPQVGIARARNRGFQAARGDFLALTDDDCLPAPDWLIALFELFRDRPEIDLLGGRVELADPRDRQVTVKTKPDRQVLASATGLDGFVHGCNLAMRRRVVTALGGCDVRFGTGTLIPAAEDTDLIYRAFLAGFGVAYEPSVVVAHAHGRRTAAAEQRLRRNYRMAIGALQTKFVLRGDRGMRAWLTHDLRRHLGAAAAAWRAPREMAAALARASHHLQGGARFVAAAAYGRAQALTGADRSALTDTPASIDQASGSAPSPGREARH